MENPREGLTELADVPEMEVCVHSVMTRLTTGYGIPDGSLAGVWFSGHLDDQSDITVKVDLTGPMLDLLATRLQEMQIAACMQGYTNRGRGNMALFRHIRRAVLERRRGR